MLVLKVLLWFVNLLFVVTVVNVCCVLLFVTIYRYSQNLFSIFYHEKKLKKFLIH